MPRDSQGNFSNVYNWEQDAANGIGIEADRHQEGDDDQAQGLTDSLDRKGRGGMQAALQMGNFAITQQAEGSGLTGGVNLGQAQKQEYSQGTDTGSANTYQVTLSPAPSAYTTGLVVRFVPNANNTGASTLQIGALTPAPALQFQNKDLVSGAITTDSTVEAVFDGTSFQITSPTTTGTAASRDVGTGDSDIPDNSTLKSTAREYTGQQTFTEATLTDGANIAWDLDTAQTATVTLAGDRTLDNPTNLKAGGTYILRVVQDATGTRTLTLGSAYKTPNGGGVTLSTAPNAVDILSFYSDGTNMLTVPQYNFS